MSDYRFIVDSSFKPFSLQEMLVPFSAYKDAYEKSEEAYTELSKGADTFKELSNTLPEDSKARKIYEGYAKDLTKQAEDLAHNGLTMGNRRALTSLKRRYQGEIGRIAQADEALRAEKKLRQSLNAQDTSRLYATDNLSIDDFLDGSNPNLYNISGNELYTRGATAGKSASSRVFGVGDMGSTLGGYYRDYVQKHGYNRETIQRFYEDMSTIPELQKAADAILEERGVNQNLTGANLQRARQSVINGMIDGAVYQESHTPQRDLGTLTASEQKQLAMQKRNQELNLAMHGLTYNEDGSVSYDPDKDPAYQKAAKIAEIKAKGKGQGKTGSGSSYDVRNKDMVIIGANTGTKYLTEGSTEAVGTPLNGTLTGARPLSTAEYAALVDNYGNITNEYIRNAIGNGSLNDYEIYVVPKGSEIDGSGWFSDDSATENLYVIKPRESKRAATNTDVGTASTDNSSVNTDIPAF